jgi:hypothetical protein
LQWNGGLTEAHVFVRLLLLLLLLFSGGLLGGTTSGSSSTTSSGGSSTSGSNVQEESSEVLASESLGVKGEPDGLNFNTSSLDKGGELVSLKRGRRLEHAGFGKNFVMPSNGEKWAVANSTHCLLTVISIPSSWRMRAA